MSKLEIINLIVINANTAEVWDWLVNPEKTKQYMFGCEAVSDWKIDSSLDWKMIHEGSELIPVKGFVKEFILNIKLVYTVIDPFAKYADIPENYLNVIYTLNETIEGVQLTVTQNGFEAAQDGIKRYQEVYNEGEGWNPILLKIKELIEG
jgi:uncharacterized protein YndB with AHSA1/START domain